MNNHGNKIFDRTFINRTITNRTFSYTTNRDIEDELSKHLYHELKKQEDRIIFLENEIASLNKKIITSTREKNLTKMLLSYDPRVDVGGWLKFFCVNCLLSFEENLEIIQIMYKKRGLKLHPDKHPGEEENYNGQFQEMHSMYETLSNKDTFNSYIRKLSNF